MQLAAFVPGVDTRSLEASAAGIVSMLNNLGKLQGLDSVEYIYLPGVALTLN